jgi:hypothetical protein
MANKIQVKRGAFSGLPVLSDGELAYPLDNPGRLYIGNGGTNRLIGDGVFLSLAGGTLTGALTLHADPTQALHPATKQYVDGLAQGLRDKTAVRAATTASITLSGTQTVDGVALAAGDRALVKDQATPAQNGVYVVAAGAWSRATQADSWDKLVSLYVFVEQGTANGDNGFVCTVDAGGTLGTTAVTWVQFSGAGQIDAGAGLTKTGNQLNVGGGNGITVGADSIAVNLDAAGGLEFNGAATRIKLDGSTLSRGASGIKITAGGVGVAEIAAAIAGNGLTGGGGAALAVGAGDGISVSADAIAANIDTAAGLKFDASTPKKIQVSANATAFSFSSGVLTPTFGASAGQFCQGNDARLFDARTPLSHAHGNITNDGKIGSASGLPVITTTAGAVTVGAFGAGAGNFCEGNDGRLHTRQHAITSTSDHTSTATSGQMLKADANGLPVNATNTDAQVAAAVTNSHAHANKALLDTYTQSEANLADAVAKKHSQNTDTGTSSATFQIGTGGPKVKNSSGVVHIRNAGDTDYANLSAGMLFALAGQLSAGGSGVIGMLELYSGNTAYRSFVRTRADGSDKAVYFPNLAGDVLLDVSTIDGGTW